MEINVKFVTFFRNPTFVVMLEVLNANLKSGKGMLNTKITFMISI